MNEKAGQHMGSLVQPVDQICMSLDSRRKLECPEKPAKVCKLSQPLSFNPKPFCCATAMLTTAPHATTFNYL